MSKEKINRKYECLRCGTAFEFESEKKLYKPMCAECKKIIKAEQRQMSARKRKIKPPNSELFAKLAEIQKYNEKHGTKLSYGQYTDLMSKKQ